MEGTAKELRRYPKNRGEAQNDIKMNCDIILFTVWKNCSGYWKRMSVKRREMLQNYYNDQRGT